MVETDKTTIASIFLFSISGLLASFLFSGETSIYYAPTIILTIFALFLSWKEHIRIPLHTLILFAFIIFSALSFFWSSAPYISLVSWLAISILPISYLTVRHILQRFPNNGAQKITYVLITLVLILCIYGFYSSYIENSSRLSSVFANPNTFSSLISICLIPSIIYLTKSGNKLLWIAVSLLLIISLILTGSRSGLLTSVITISLIFYFTPINNKQKYIALLICTYSILGAIFYLLDFTFFTRIIDTFSDTYSDSTQGRILIWSGAINLAKDNIIYGTGLGSFFLEYPQYRLPFDPSAGDWAHNDTLQILTELGAIGALLWLGFWSCLLYSLIRNHKKISHYALIGSICSIGFFIQGNITYLYLVMPVLFITGGCLALYDNEITSFNIKIKKLHLLIPSILIIIVTTQSMISMLLAKSAQKNMVSAQKEKAIKQIQFIDRYGSPHFYKHNLILGKRGDFNALEKIKNSCQSCASPYFIEGLINLQSGNIKEAKSSLWKAMRKDPSDQNIRLHFIRILEAQGKNKEAAVIAKVGFNYPTESEYEHYFKETISKSEQKQ